MTFECPECQLRSYRVLDDFETGHKRIRHIVPLADCLIDNREYELLKKTNTCLYKALSWQQNKLDALRLAENKKDICNK